LDMPAVGKLMFILGIFKYLYNDDCSKVEEQSRKRAKNQYKLNTFQIKIEERKIKEDEFLAQLWYKVNPVNIETVDANIMLEVLKLIYDPYAGP
jgi:hypothetical protein